MLTNDINTDECWDTKLNGAWNFDVSQQLIEINRGTSGRFVGIFIQNIKSTTTMLIIGINCTDLYMKLEGYTFKKKEKVFGQLSSNFIFMHTLIDMHIKAIC